MRECCGRPEDVVEHLVDVGVVGHDVVGDAEHPDESVQDEGGAREQQVPADDEGPDGSGGQEQVGERVVDRVRHPVPSTILRYGVTKCGGGGRRTRRSSFVSPLEISHIVHT